MGDGSNLNNPATEEEYMYIRDPKKHVNVQGPRNVEVLEKS